MAKILYGVAGEGSGHSSRAKEIINHLLENGHQVKIVSSDRGYVNLGKYFDVEKIFGLKFVFKNNRVQNIPTAVKNLFNSPDALKSIQKVLNIIDKEGIQMVFSDFEPISGVAANIRKLPLISIDNQHRIINAEVEYPKEYTKEAMAAKAVVNMVIFNSKACLVSTFFDAKTTNSKTFFFPPILREEVLKVSPQTKDYILVYISSKSETFLDVLKDIDKKFIIYGLDKEDQDGNVTFKKASQEEFLKDLANCDAVMANSGFTLITEALHLGKPYLAIPIKGQFEQVLNAYYLEKLGYGKYWDEINKEKIEAFLYNIEKYRNNLSGYKKENNSRIFRKINELVKEYS